MMRRKGTSDRGFATGGGSWPLWALIVLALVGGERARAQNVSFEALVPQDDLTALLMAEDRIVAGTANGGLLISSRSNPGDFHLFPAGKQMSSNRITALAWTGQHVWAATDGGGLTRISDPGPAPGFKMFSQGIGGLSLTAVTGIVIGGNERVYYGIAGGGVGQLINGRTGVIYTVDRHGLIDDTILDLEIFGDDLFVATPLGVSRISDGEITDQVAGLTNLYIYSLDVDDQGDLLAAGRGGLYRWDPVGEAWQRLGGMGFWIYEVSCGGGQIWVRSGDGAGGNLLGLWNGVDFTIVDAPYQDISSLWADQELWLGGPAPVDPTWVNGAARAYLARRETSAEFADWVVDSMLPLNCKGATLGRDGRAWLGADSKVSVSAFDGDGWFNIFELAEAENDSSGLFNHGGNVLGMAIGADGRIWFSQIDAGVLVHDPDTGTTTLVKPDDSPLSGARVIRIVAHPDGPLFFMHDASDPGVVDVLFDPEHWRDPTSWYFLPTGAAGLQGASAVLDAVVERPDVIWFAAEDVGLIRWDVNGGAVGPDWPLTWADPSDDRWDSALADFPGISNDPRVCEALACAADGFLWAGGDGVVRFQYQPATRTIDEESLEGWGLRAEESQVGLVSGSVKDVVVDANGDCWVATDGGVNRIKIREEGVDIDAWFAPANYLGSTLNQTLYSFNSINNLPGVSYANLALSDNGLKLLIAADAGGALVTVEPYVPPAEQGLAALFFYPNPFLPGQADGGLRLGGIGADNEAGDPARVEIYNVEGQLVYRDYHVSADSPFWDGRNRVYKDAASGMYVVKVTWRGESAVRALSVVR